MRGANPLAALLVACVAALVACSPLAADDDVPPSLQVRWEDTPIPQQPMLHRHTDGIAVAPDGSFVVAALSGRPINQLALIDLRTRTARILSGPDPRVLLGHPAVSFDGQRIAMVATPLGRFGTSDVWIVDPRTGVAQVISEPERSFRHPAFSPDGTRLAYFRDIEETRWREGRMRPEYRNFLPYALFERDLHSNEERQLSGQPFLSPCHLSYDTLSRGLFYCAGEPLVRSPLSGNRSVWMIPSWSDDYREQTGGASNFFFRWGEETPPRPPLYAPTNNPLTQYGRVAGALSHGRVLLTGAVGPDGGAQRNVGVAFDGASAALIFSPDDLESGDGNLSASTDANVIVGMKYRAINSAAPLAPTVIVQRGDAVEVISADEVNFGNTIVIAPSMGERDNGGLQ